MKIPPTLTLLLFSALHGMSQNQNLFASFLEEDSVVMSLKQFGLSEVPKQIVQLTKATVLVIYPDVIEEGWTIYPPQSAFEEFIDKPPFRNLPDEITHLTKLRDLTLRQLALKKLPEKFSKLENLEKLDLSLNKLTIKDELEKLKRLDKLRHLSLFGNRVTKDDILQLKAANPALYIDMEEYFKAEEK